MRPRDLVTLEYPRLLEALAALARSAAGRQRLLSLAPTTIAAEADRRLSLLAEAAALASEAGRPPTADVPLLAPALTAAAPEGAALECRRLAELGEVIGVGRHARAWLRRDGARFPALAALAETLPPAAEVEAALDCTLDERGQVRDDASPALAAARAVVRELRVQLEARLLRLVRDPEMADTVSENYVTVRNGRFVVPIRIAAAGTVAGVVQDRSSSGETAFIEPLFAVDLNNRLLLAAKDEEAEERRVRAEVTALVREHAAALAALEDGLAVVDALGAAAAFADAHGCTRPVLGADDIALAAARHPLLLTSGRPVVPVDLRMRADQRGLAITGPNTGGKTVALKTLGLCVLMAQAGLFVPAAMDSRLPFFDAVFVDLGDEQSIDRDLSTFSAHAENLADIARLARRGGLVLLDEPGAGTDPVEGAALAVGVLTDLLERGPRLVFTSHFPQVKTFALVGDSHDVGRAVARLEASRREYEERRDAAEAERARLAAARGETEALAADLRARQRRRWADDLGESRRFLEDLQRRGTEILAELRRRPERAPLRAFAAEAEQAIAAHEADLGAAPERPPVPGETVEVVGRGIRGELVEIAGPRARIQRGGLKFEVPADQLRVVPAGPARERIAVAVERPAEIADEINLVGRRAREAIDALAAFLDRAVRAGASEVRVIHGLGSGALRRAVHEFLAESPYCAAYRDAEPSAGGAGVTIAELA